MHKGTARMHIFSGICLKAYKSWFKTAKTFYKYK